MKKIRIIITIVLLFVVCALVYSQRVRISDRLFEAQKEQLPEAVGFAEFETGESEDVESADGDAVLSEAEESQEEGLEVIKVDEAIEEIEESEQDDAILSEAEGSQEEGLEVIEVDEVIEELDDAENRGEAAESIPKEINLAVPFTSQAPHSNWDMPYQEACEEAAIYMVHEYYSGTGKGKINADTADAALLAIVAFEEELLGFYKDTTVDETVRLIESYYGYSHVEVIDNPSVGQIKEHVAAGRPVIVPAAGRELGNPNFTAPGPIYHFLVIKGYTDATFITNDPGTRRGEDYVYQYNTIMNAMHDWNGGEVLKGDKKVIVVYPE